MREGWDGRNAKRNVGVYRVVAAAWIVELSGAVRKQHLKISHHNSYCNRRRVTQGCG